MKVTYLPSGAFRRDLDREVDDYFARSGLHRHATAAVHWKTAILFAWLVTSYVALVFFANDTWQAVLLSVSLGCAMAAVGFNVQHDGGHQAYSSNKAVNRAMGFSLDLLGGSSYFWRFKHNIAHHTYPNISGADDDIYIGPLGRLSPHDRHYGFHRFQYLYMWGLYALLAVKWQLLDDFRFIARPGIAATSVPRPGPFEHALFWLGKILFFTFALVIPLLRHEPWNVIGCFALTGAVLGLVLGAVFQLAHCIPHADYACPSVTTGCAGRDWATYQVESAANFGRDNRLLTWFVGGLNFQIEHHLFPKICHIHYPALSPLVEQVCARHGVRYFAYPTFGAALRSHYQWLRRLGLRPEVSTVAERAPA